MASQRLLNPVYNHLDNGNPSKALKECDLILRKQSKKATLTKSDQIWQTTNALKSIALQRLHRIEEALELVDSVAQAEPSDETVLQMLSNIYRDCNKPEFIPKIYENALKKNESEDLYTHAFMAYLRNENYMQMKLIGAKLYSKYKQYPYMYWSAMAGYLQGVLENPQMTKMNLTLARRFIEKDFEKVENERQVKLYLLILEELGDFDTIEKVLESHKGHFAQTLHGYKDKLLKLYKARKNFDKIIDQLLERIDADDNDWGAWKNLIKTVTIDQKESENLKMSTNDVIQLIDEKSISTRGRAAHLARLEFIKNYRGIPEHWGDNIFQIFLNYCSRFRTKASTFHDLEPYFDLLEEKDDEKYNLVQSLRNTFENKENLEDENIEAICCSHLLSYQLALVFGKTLENDVPNLLKFALNIVEKTKNFEKIKNLMSTEPRAWDRHFLLAAQTSLVRSEETGKIDLLRVLAILELGISCSGTNSDLLLMALNIYARADCDQEAINKAVDLDIKSIQLDSMGYVLFPHLCRLNPEGVLSFLQTAMHFYSYAHKDTTDMIIKCYQNGRFDKILDMMKFRDAILDSEMRRLSSTEHQLLASAAIENEKSLEVLSRNSSDNRDLEGLNLYYPSKSENIDRIKMESRIRNSCWLELRETQLQITNYLLQDDLASCSLLVPDLLSKMSTSIEKVAKSNRIPEDIWTITVGLHDPVCLGSDHKEVLSLTFSVLNASFGLKMALLSEKSVGVDELNSLEKSLQNVKKILEAQNSNFHTRWFIVESVMQLEQILKTVSVKIKALRNGFLY